MTSRPPAVVLLDRRAEVLARIRRCRAEGADTDLGDEHELAELTTALSEYLDGDIEVRRIGLEADEELARALAALEPVHPVGDEADLRDRFADDRRVFVLEHPALPGRPMNVVWVALWEGLPDRLTDVLDPERPTGDPADADTAVFYSIWNAEPGLAGLGRGTELLEGAVEEELADELPGLVTFVTLSPVPGFREWLHPSGLDGDSPTAALRAACARYLTSVGGDGRLLDPVARFHLGNGARLLRVLDGADPSPRGRQRSFGLMANYRYDPEDRVANHAALARGAPAVSEEVELLLR